MHWVLRSAAALVCLASVAHGVCAADDLDTLEEKAINAAVDRVAPSVVRIETVGGLERVQGVLFGAGPTTGLVVDPQGYIVSSAFNFVNKPSSILVRLPDGTRKPAKLVASDHSRKIVLLKIEVEHPLPVADFVPEAQMRVGQWSIAVGRTFEDQRPNLSVGLLSTVERIWGKAIQTDAAVSPNNYGGPLVDIRGRVLGVLVPLSPQSAEELAGIEWYDSGIGFAVPMEAIRRILPKLRQGEDLWSGVIGIYFQSKNLYTGDTALAACRPNSPADKAGFKSGDRIVEVDGRKTSRAADVRQALSRRYAGDKVHVAVLRGQQRIERDVELVAKLEPYQHGFLGVLPRRGSAEGRGVRVRWVFPESSAAGAKIEPGDTIVSLDGKPVHGRDELLRAISGLEPGMKTDLEVRHNDQTRTVKVVLAAVPERLPPAQLPAAQDEAKVADGPRPKVGLIALRVPEFKNEAWAYVPQNYTPAAACGLIVWLHGAVAPQQKDLLAQWKPLCDAHGLILVAPRCCSDASNWQADEADYVEKLVGQVRAGYTVDPTRTLVFGRDTGASLAYMVAFRPREIVRAVAVIDAGTILPPPEAEPGRRLSVFLGTVKDSSMGPLVAMTLARLREMKIPVTQKDLGRTPRDLSAEELAELARWVDMLDQI